MATLVLDSPGHASAPELSAPRICLRTWLRDGWSILFSHPHDFIRCELELDRWLVIMREAFAQHGIRPLSLTPPGSTTWIAQATGDDRAVELDGSRPGSGAVDLPARTLRDTIASLAQRFVMIIDSTLRIHRTYTYTPGASVPSPLEFLALASSLRSTQSASGSGQPPYRVVPRRNTARHRHRPAALECRPLIQIRTTRSRFHL